jgi:hypothetical protein
VLVFSTPLCGPVYCSVADTRMRIQTTVLDPDPDVHRSLLKGPFSTNLKITFFEILACISDNNLRLTTANTQSPSMC